MVKACILQPNFIPWMGYFEIIKACRTCVIYDNASYSKNTFHNRNYILLNNKSLFNWSLPLKSYELGASFNDIKVNYSDRELKKLHRTFDQNFNKSEYYPALQQLLDCITKKDAVLSKVNIRSIELIMNALEIDTQIIRASDLSLSSNGRSEKLAEILEKVGATVYVSSAGAQGYLEEDSFSQKFKGKVEFMEFTCERSKRLMGDNGVNLSALSLLLEGLL